MSEKAKLEKTITKNQKISPKMKSKQIQCDTNLACDGEKTAPALENLKRRLNFWIFWKPLVNGLRRA